ncbi:hypothetical protein ABWK22_01715 [Gottfriedia acidiceleris]|uniref:hypothetical protein n=1 Tax=Gottfriedia acidiceleris TaxID=371036 RepID=UPI003394DBD9
MAMFGQGRLIQASEYFTQADYERRQNLYRMEYMSIPYMPEDRMNFNQRNDEDGIEDYLARERETSAIEERYRREREIGNKVQYMHQDFIRRYGMSPNTLFVNREDYYHLMRSYPGYIVSNNMASFHGLKVVQTIDEESYVGLIPIN